ncbi:MAG: Bax inhibitor-1/YccA family protein [Anaerolineae bacterium]|nr:Bax inhibitor-1/YccA family protein [Anaerolineae bacterium]MDW8172235.1 Bax inhibitor-1/YccA family protein [Anaerolineae bacterium]
MQNYGRGQAPVITAPSSLAIDMNPIMRAVYGWMTLGLVVTAFISLFITQQAVLPNGMPNIDVLNTLSGLMLPAIIVQLVIALGLSFLVNRISPVVSGVLFFVYSAITGLTFGVIFTGLAISGDFSAVVKAFFSTAGVFGAMTLVGLTTKTDLTRMGSFLMMALIGLIIASVINIFLRSDAFGFIISIVGVLIFTGLTAYDTQKIKEMAHEAAYSGDSGFGQRVAIMGAFTLYLDFINLFLYLLRIFASSRD